MSKKKKLICLATSLMLVLSLVLFGCGGGGSESSGAPNSGSGSSGSSSAEIVTVTPGVITVGSDCDYPPFIEMDGEQPAGYEYDLLKAIATQMGYELEYLPPQSFDTILVTLASNTKMDLGCSSFTINDERKEIVDFSTPYFDSNQAVVALDSSSYTSAMDFNGQVVGAQSGTTGAEWVKENLTDEGTVLQEYNMASEMMAALLAGKIQGAFYDEPAAAQQVATTYAGEAHIVESIPTGEQYGFAISKDNPGLLEAVNQAMIEIKENGTFDKIFAQYFPGLTPPNLGVTN